MSATRCKCGHKKTSHTAQSENYDAPLVCDDPECPCEEYEPDENEDPV